MSFATVTAGHAFDALAESYETSFTNSLVGRAQRNAVWRECERVFGADDYLLELNCGTGEDAIFLARLGASLVCCDASPKMIEVARRRVLNEPGELDILFNLFPTEGLSLFKPERPFDGVLSNFSGLNCVENLARVAQNLASITRPRATAVLCLSTRFCLWEVLFYGVQGRIVKATRRWPGKTQAKLNDTSFSMHYPTIAQMKRDFLPWFVLRHIRGIGVFVPPSYVERWARKFPAAFRFTEKMDRIVSKWPLFRTIGDHVLLVFERTLS